MINDIIIGLSNIFGYGGFVLMLFVFVALTFAFNQGLGFIASIVSVMLTIYMMYSLDITLAPLVSSNMIIGIFIIFGLLTGFLVYAALVRD